MPLLDHFHPPGDGLLPWDSLHSGWATRVADDLTARMPPQFLALEHTHVGPQVEIDVATFEKPKTATPLSGNGGGVATLPQTWAPPVAVCAVPLVFPDRFEVRVFMGSGKAGDLVGAIEFISPGNKDRAEERQAFAVKCASYLHQGVSVVIIDVVTARRANLHNEILRLVNANNDQAFLPEDVSIYAAAYRPALRNAKPECDVWHQPCAVGEPLPVMPLRLTGDLFVPVEFEAAYTETCRRRRVMG